MIDKGYLYAKDEKRLFINPSLGCASKCKYCYLSKLGIESIKRKTWEEILYLLNESDYKLSKDTLITIGCFSECFDKLNKKETLKILKYFLKKGNQVQLSTKCYITYEDIKDIIPLIKYHGQLVIFVSSTTISEYKNYESGTEQLEQRFKTFDLINYNIPVVLYMKPVLQNITIKDISEYKKLIIDKSIANVVVGSLFTEEKSNEEVHFLDKNVLFYNECDDEKQIIEYLNKDTKTWIRSSEVMESFKKKHEIIENIKSEVYNLLNKENSGHNFEHINRVYNMSIRFANQEKADEFIVALIALLHDVDDYKLFGEENADNLSNAKMLMNKYDVDIDTQEKVLESIKTIGYKKSLQGIRPNSLEGMIVSDADMCDGLGVTGILRTYDYQKFHGKPFFDKSTFPNKQLDASTYKLVEDSAVCHCFEKLLRLKKLMLTNSGKKEASNRHDILVSVLYHLFEEENTPEWSEYLDNFLKDFYS